MDIHSDNFRPQCPYCAKGQGEVRAVKVGALTTRRLTFQCGVCTRTWYSEMPEPRLGLFAAVPMRDSGQDAE